MKRIIFFGTYNPAYPRARYIRNCFESSGIEIISINDRSSGFMKYLRLFMRLYRAREYDAVYVGFPGNLAMIVASCATRKPIIFDAFVSLYDTYVHDRGSVSEHGVMARWYRWLDTVACLRATKIMVDTKEHALYFAQTFSIPLSKITAVDAMTDLALFLPHAPAPHEKCIVYWHGKYSLFHNVECIVQAAAQLSPERYEFRLLGSGGDKARAEQMVQEMHLAHVRFLPPVSYEQLPVAIADADICLGVFGTSEKVQRVVPNKVYEYMACGKLVITKNSRACVSILPNAEISYIADGPTELAKAIEEMYAKYGSGHVSSVNRSLVASRDANNKSVCASLLQSL